MAYWQNNLEFKRAVAQRFDPDTDYSNFEEAEIEGAFEATVMELLTQSINFGEVSIPEVNDTVTWNYGQGKGTGKVKKLYTKPVTLRIGEADITRNGTKENPALLIVQGKSRVLKLASEVQITEEVDYEEVAIAYSFDFDGKYDHIDLTPTKGMIEAAKQAKKYLDEGHGGDGLERETLRWVNLVASGRSLSIEKAKKGYKFFQRHNTYKDNKSEGDTNPKSPAPWYVARLCWFGDDGEKFFNRVWRQIQAADADEGRGQEEEGRSMNEAQPSSLFPLPSSLDFGSIIHNKFNWNGLELGVEFAPGGVRFPGRKFARKLKSGYGHIRRRYDQKGRSLDCYLAPEFFSDATPSDRLYRIKQINPETQEFDQWKYAIGYDSIDTAKSAYLQEMPEDRYGGIQEIAITDLEQPQFNEQLLTKAVQEVLAPHLQKIDDLAARIAEFSAPIKIEGVVLSDEELKAIASDISTDEAIEDWEKNAPEQYKELLSDAANA